MLRAQIDNDRDWFGGSGTPEVIFRPLSFAEHRTFAKRSHVKDRKVFDMTYFGSTRVVDQACAHSLPRVFTVAGRHTRWWFSSVGTYLIKHLRCSVLVAQTEIGRE